MPNCGGLCLALDLIQLPLLGACDGTAYLRSLLNDASHDIRDGVYHSHDRRFSVAVPQAAITGVSYSAQRLIRGDAEYVFFIPSVGAEPIYGVGTRANLPEPDTSMSLDEYATFAGTDSHLESLTDSTSFRPLRSPLQVQLDGRPALLQIYAGLDESSAVESYLLVYVSKDAHTAEFLSIATKEACPHCASGSETEILTDLPSFASYVRSFHLAAGVAKP